jgi:tetratricopeptide (TPR) repeat protein
MSGMVHPGMGPNVSQGHLTMSGQPGQQGAVQGSMMSAVTLGGFMPGQDQHNGAFGGASLQGGGQMMQHQGTVSSSEALMPGNNMQLVPHGGDKRAAMDFGDFHGVDSSKGGKKASKRSLTATIERMEKHKIVERKRREKTRELMTELQALIPSVENVQDSLTMNAVLEEAIQHLKDQHGKSTALVVAKPQGEGEGDTSLARAFGKEASTITDGLSLMHKDAIVQGEPTAAVKSLEVTSSKAATTLNLSRLPDQEFRYFRLVLMQETLYAKMLENWEQKIGEELVRQALSLLCVSREGLSQQELEEMLQIKQRGLETQWHDLARDLNADLSMKSEGLLGFVYSAFRLAVERRYLKSPEQRRATEQQLAEYWEKKVGGESEKRIAGELPYVLERMGEWERLRTCLSSSLDVLYQLYNDASTADLLRFWRKGVELEEGSGYAAAAQTYIARLKRFESDGATPQLLWESSLITARFLGDAGQFSEAEKILARARELAKEMGGNDRFVAEVSLRCAELLNKCAASTPEYPLEMMVRSAFYAKEAADLYAYMTDDQAKRGYATALYWMGLNFGTVCRIGGGGTWSAKRAHDIAEQALGKCLAVRGELGEGESKTTEVLFGQGVLAFCKAEAIQLEAIQPSGDKTADGEILELQEKALETFKQVHAQFSDIYSPKHLEAVKCLTMMGLVNKCLGRLKAALECYAKEVAVRDEVQGEMHPRAQQARRVYNDLIEQVASMQPSQATEAPPQQGGEEVCKSERPTGGEAEKQPEPVPSHVPEAAAAASAEAEKGGPSAQPST